MSSSPNRYTGACFALAAAALFGVSTPFAKALLGNAVDPWLLAGLLYAGSGAGLGLVLALRGEAWAEASLRRADAPWLGGVVLFGGLLAPLLLMQGLVTSSAASASLLLNLESVATMVIAWMVFKESVDRRLLLGAFAMLAGAILLSWQGLARFEFGALCIVGACIAWGVDNNLTRQLSGSDPLQIAAIKGLAAGAVNLALAAWRNVAWPGWSEIAQAALLGFIGYGLSLVLFVLALRQLGAARTGAYFSTAPFIGAMVAVSWLGEALDAALIVAGLLMAFGVYLHLTEDHAHEHDHEELEHEHGHTHDVHHQHEHAADDPEGERHSHLHRHVHMRHKHPHFPDIHHRHPH